MRARPVGYRRMVAAYRAAMRVSPRARRRARHREVATKNTYMRRAVYYRQNGCERLTPRQRRRVQHKENAGRGA